MITIGLHEVALVVDTGLWSNAMEVMSTLPHAPQVTEVGHTNVIRELLTQENLIVKEYWDCHRVYRGYNIIIICGIGWVKRWSWKRLELEKNWNVILRFT